MKNAEHDLLLVYLSAGNLKVDATDYPHTIIKVITMNGEVYALDMTGAQYGWTECIVPWKVYVESRVREFKDVVPFGGTKVRSNMTAKTTGGHFEQVHGINVLFAQVVDAAVMFWQRCNILTTDLFRLPEQDFQKKQASLLDAVEEFLQKEKAFQKSQGSFEFKAGFSGGIQQVPIISAGMESKENAGSLNLTDKEYALISAYMASGQNRHEANGTFSAGL